VIAPRSTKRPEGEVIVTLPVPCSVWDLVKQGAHLAQRTREQFAAELMIGGLRKHGFPLVEKKFGQSVREKAEEEWKRLTR
jgi:hypothetical protein